MDALTSASSSTPPWKYDVFLSFRGEDTRKNFTDHLYTALEHKSIHTFRDDEKLERGKDISPALLKAIEESQFAIVVFSRNYANSSWCLDEVTKISKCKKELGQTILPIFYDVEPTDVRKQEGSFGEAFSKHRKNFKDNMERVDNWAKALAEIASISGWDVKHRHESNVIREIVENILRTLDLTFPSSEDKDLVGMVSRVRQTRLYLDKESDGVHTIGIWGTGGIGKTTTAKEVFKSIYGKFEAFGFVNVREQSEKLGLVHARKQLHEMLLDEKIKLQDVDNNVLKRRLSSKKVLIVLDDVDQLQQIEALVGKADEQPNWFGPGSRIIVTTRDKDLLKSYGKDNIYEIEKLSDDEALRLFCRRAFKKNDPEDEYREVSKNVVKYAQGLPLALELLGCLLNGRDIDQWVDAVKRLEDNPTNELCKILQLSYEGLESKEKQIFLDIACFFKGEDEHRVKKILESCDFNPTKGFSILVQKSLITIEEGKLRMHDLVQEMGWEVVREEKIDEPGERSRIWLHKDCIQVLAENTGSRSVQGLFLSWSGEEKVVPLDADPFSEMKNIRLLKIFNVYLSGCPQYSLAKKLRLLEWHGFPLATLPSSFQPDKLVELSMPNSRIQQLWKETDEIYEQLILINLRNCEYLTKAPDFRKVPNLESLILEGCERLTEVHPSIGVLHHLVTLNLKDCKRLKKLPKSIKLKALKTFTLSGCISLSEFPEIDGEMENLSELDINGTAIRELPVSISRLTGLVLFTLTYCNNLCSLPGSMLRSLTFLKYLIMSSSSHIDKLPEYLENLENLEQLFADGTSIREVPSSVLLLKKLKVLCFRGCKGLQLPNSLLSLSSLTKLDLSFCDLPEGAIPDDIGCLSLLEHLNLSGNYFTSIPDSISELSRLTELYLLACCNLQSLPKNLPSSLKLIDVNDCYSLKISNDMTARISEDGLHFVSSNNAFGSVADSTIGTPFPMAEENIAELLPKFFEGNINDKKLFEFRFPFGNRVSECCSNWENGSSIMMKSSPDDHRNTIRKGIALFVVFQIKKRENSYYDDQQPEAIHCHIDSEEGRVENFISFHDFREFRVGSFGACSYIPQDQFPRRLNQESQVVGVSVSVNSPNLEIKKCGLHVIHELNVKEFCHKLALCYFEELDAEAELCQHYRELLDEAMIGYVKTILPEKPLHEAEETYTVEDTSDPTSQMTRDLESLLSRLFQGLVPRTCFFYFSIPASSFSPWFFHHSLGDTTIFCYLPPNLHDDESWLGLELYALFERRQLENIPTMLGVELYVHAGSNTLPVQKLDVEIKAVLGPQLLLIHIPCQNFPEQLNQSAGISVLFKPTTPDVEVELCGTGLLYEKGSKGLARAITNIVSMWGPKSIYSLREHIQILLQQMEAYCESAEIGERKRVKRDESDCFSSFQSEKRHLMESLHKLLTSMEPMTKDVSTSTLFNYRYGLRDEHRSDEEYYSRSGVISHSALFSFQQIWEGSVPEALTCHYFYHLHVMVDTLVLHGNDFEKWKRNLKIFLETSFNSWGLVTLSFKGHIISVLKYFNPLAPFNFKFPSKEIPKWFDHQNDWSTSAIKLPPTLHEDKNWMGVVICASFSIHEHPSSFSETSFKILCHLVSNGTCVNVAPVHSITKDKFSWLHVHGFIWLTYVPHSLLMDLKEGSHVLARIYNQTPGLTVNKCGIRLLYKRDLPEFKQAIIQCWTCFFDNLDPIFRFVADEDGKILHDDNRVGTRGISDKILRSINPQKTNYQVFDGESVYNACFPPIETLEWFADLSCDHLATINQPQDLYSDVNWIGLALCAYFSNPDDQQPVANTSSDNLDSELFSQYLFCHFKTEDGNSRSIHQYQYQYRRSNGNLNQLDKKGFIWVSFLPRRWFLETIPPSCQLDEYRILEASFGSDAPGMVANKCGLRLVYQHDQEEFKQVLNKLMDCQQSDQEPKAEDGNVQKAFGPIFVKSLHAETKESPLVYDPIREFAYDIKFSAASPTNKQERNLEDTMLDPSISEFDDIVTDIQNILDSKGTTEPESKEKDILPTFKTINRAKKLLKQFMEMKLETLVHPGRKFDLKESLSILLSTRNVFPKVMVDEMTKFSEMFNQNCHHYETAQKDIEEVKGKESVVAQLENKLKQFNLELKPMKSKVDTINREIAELEKQMIEKKTEREKLQSSFEDLKGQATSSKEALVKALRDVELAAKKKKEAEEFVKQLEDGWQTLVDHCSQYI